MGDRKKVLTLQSMDVKIIAAFRKIKQEIEDHRETINENTNEIQSNYEYLCKLESKIDKLVDRIDELTLLSNEKGTKPANDDVSKEVSEKPLEVSRLSLREQEVFMVLYIADKELTYKDIARKTALNESLVMNYVITLISKGVPVIKKYINNLVYLILEQDFKQLQAKENVLHINQSLSSQMEL